MATTEQSEDARPEVPADPARTTPDRGPGSIRRTSHIDMTFGDEGFDPRGGAPMWLRGRARDLLTTPDGAAAVVDAASFTARTGLNRVVEEIDSDPPRPGLGQLVGQRGGSGFRKQLDGALPGEREAGTLLYYLLDDVPPATLISGYVWSRYGDGGRPPARLAPPSADALRATPHLPAPARGPMIGICSGWRAGGTAVRLLDAGSPPIGSTVDAPDLLRAEDPLAWHDLDELPPGSMRRRRRVDVVPAGGGGDGDAGRLLTVDAMFRDSCRTPEGDEVVVHEYSLAATVDARSGTIADVVATPRVLPFVECPWAADNVGVLEGQRADGLRATVLQLLTGTDCCTHLNDALRALAEVPVLAGLSGRG